MRRAQHQRVDAQAFSGLQQLVAGRSPLHDGGPGDDAALVGRGGHQAPEPLLQLRPVLGRAGMELGLLDQDVAERYFAGAAAGPRGEL